MRLNTTDFRRKMQHPLLLAVGSLPLAMMLILNFAPDAWSRMWALPLAFVGLAWICLLLPGRKRLIGGAAGAVLLAGLSAVLLPLGETIVLALAPVMYIALLAVTLPIGGWPRSRELAVGWHVAGILTHVFLQMMITLSARTEKSLYAPARTPLVFSFLVYAVLVLLALNRASLDSAAQSRRTVPLLMRRQNIVITLALLVLGVGIAAIPAIGTALDGVWDAVLRGIAWIAGLLAALLPRSDGVAGGPAAAGDSDFGLGEAAPPSDLALLLEKVIGVAALIILIVALVLVGRAAAKKLVKLAKYLWARLGQYGALAGEDYEDEITSTRDEPDTDREGAFRRLRRMTERDTAGSPSEQVRMRYKRLRRQRGWAGASTARENIPEEVAVLYERTRYGGQALTEEDAARFREGTRRV